MLLYHITPAANRKSIEARGLLASKSRRDVKDTWLVSGRMVPYAISHVMGRHGDVVYMVCTVNVPDEQLTRTRNGDMYRTTYNIPARWVECGPDLSTDD